MRNWSKLLAGMLVAVLAAAILPIAGWANSSGHFGHSAPCHGDMPSPPAPDSHQCCAAVHQWAIPGSPIVLHSVLAHAGSSHEADEIQPFLFSHPTHAFIFDSPPVTTSLRI